MDERKIYNEKVIARHLASENAVERAFGRCQKILNPAMEEYFQAQEEAGETASGVDGLMHYTVGLIAQVTIRNGMPPKERARFMAVLVRNIPQAYASAERQIEAFFAAEDEPAPEALTAAPVPDFLKAEGGQ